MPKPVLTEHDLDPHQKLMDTSSVHHHFSTRFMEFGLFLHNVVDKEAEQVSVPQLTAMVEEELEISIMI